MTQQKSTGLTDAELLKLRLEWEEDCRNCKDRGDEPLLYPRLIAAVERKKKKLLLPK